MHHSIRRWCCAALAALLIGLSGIPQGFVFASGTGGDTALTYGMRDNDDVKAMQKRLKALSYFSDSATGNYFDATAKAVEAFQKANGLAVNRKLASAEMLALLYGEESIDFGSLTPDADSSESAQSDSPAVSALKYGMYGDARVERMQARLKELGYFEANCTGGYYSETAAAVAAFQKACGLTVNKKLASVEMLTILYSDAAPAAGTAPTSTPTATPAATAQALSALKYGMYGDARVERMQERLKELGYFGTDCTGGYYSVTASAVAAFQAACGLGVDKNNASVEMLSMLYSASAPAKGSTLPTNSPTPTPSPAATAAPTATPAANYSALSYGSCGSQVKQMQQRLQALGFFTSSYGCTGGYYADTATAVAAFQVACGLSANKNQASAAMLALLYSDAAPRAGETLATPSPSATPSPTPSATASPTDAPATYAELRRDMEGSAEVKAMQARLKELKYFSATPTGGYFSLTVDAVAAFQKACGLTVNGNVASSAMLAILYSDRAPEKGQAYEPDASEVPAPSATPEALTALSHGMQSDAVKRMQSRLKELGYFTVSVTGGYYDLTDSAVAAFQQACFLEVNKRLASVEMLAILYSDSAPQKGTVLATPTPEGGSGGTDYSGARTDLILCKGSTGEQVLLLNTRLIELGYLTGTPASEFTSATTTAVKWFQNNNKLSSDGVAGPKTLSALYASNPVEAGDEGEVPVTEPTTPPQVSGTPVKPAIGTVIMPDWSDETYFDTSKGVFSVGTTATVTDIATGITFQVRRKGGYNHADCEPLTAFDTWQMFRAYGGEEWSWNRRAIFVTVGSTTFAASMNGMPHDSTTISSNNFPGHFCIHFLNSRTHGTNNLDSLHQACVKQAAAASVSSVQSKINAQ